MTEHLVIRSLASPAELDLFLWLSYTLDDELAGDLAAGRRHPEWMWVALRGGRLEARAAWWGRAGDAAPSVLDVLDVSEVPDRLETGGACCGRRSARSSRRDPPRPSTSGSCRRTGVTGPPHGAPSRTRWPS